MSDHQNDDTDAYYLRRYYVDADVANSERQP